MCQAGPAAAVWMHAVQFGAAGPHSSKKPTLVCHVLGACLGGSKGHPPGPHPFRPRGFRISHPRHQIPDSLDSTATFHPCIEGETPQTLLKNSGKNMGVLGRVWGTIPAKSWFTSRHGLFYPHRLWWFVASILDHGSDKTYLPGWGARGVQDKQLCLRDWSQTVPQSPCFISFKGVGT